MWAVRIVCSSCCIGILLVMAASQALAITIDTVPVGNPGNANDSTGFGAVNYSYSIDKNEVTIGQYAAFLNAVAATDSFSLYNPSMASDLNIAGISQSGASGSFTYSVIGSANKPITYVSWGDAARFCNWLANGQPGLTGGPVPENAASTEDGSYVLNGAVTGSALNAISRKAGATWVIPTQNEWYKAAYYQPPDQGGDTDGYWAYATRHNGIPSAVAPPGTSAPTPSNTVNERDTIGQYAVTGSSVYSATQNYLTDVGAYTQSVSFYGTFDQTGGVNEWNEDFINTQFPTAGARPLRGGSWHDTGFDDSSVVFASSPLTETNNLGFRVAEVPEPASVVLAALGFLGVAALRRSWRS